MKVDKYELLMKEFLTANGCKPHGTIKDNAVLCNYKGVQIRIENGANISQPGKYILISEANAFEQHNEANLLLLNARLDLTEGGYFAKFADESIKFLRTFRITEHPNELMGNINSTYKLINNIANEIEKDVVR
jgi:hypothetical protein